jgi:predicted DNA-binding protein YlxM (UPF0122 family)
MILPNTIKSSRHRVRDTNILRLYARENLTMEEIGLKFGLTTSRIHQIIYTNRSLIDWDKIHEKNVRIASLKRLQKLHPESIGKKSTLDIIDQLRKEIEGDSPLIDNRQITQIIHYGEAKKLENADDPSRHIPAA